MPFALTVSSTLDCVRNCISRKLKGVSLNLYITRIRPYLKCCIQFQAPQYKTDMDILEKVSWRITRNGIEFQIYFKKSLDSCECSVSRREGLGGFISVYKYFMARVRKTKLPSDWCPLTEQERNVNKNRKFCSNMERNFLPGGCSEQVSERYGQGKSH